MKLRSKTFLISSLVICFLFATPSLARSETDEQCPPIVELTSHNEGQEVSGESINLKWKWIMHWDCDWVLVPGGEYMKSLVVKGPDGNTLINEDYTDNPIADDNLPSELSYSFEENGFDQKETNKKIEFTFELTYYDTVHEVWGDAYINLTKTDLMNQTIELNFIGLSPRSKTIRTLDEYKYVIIALGIALISLIAYKKKSGTKTKRSDGRIIKVKTTID